MTRENIKKTVVGSLIICLILSFLVVKPLISHRDAVKVVNYVLMAWKDGDAIGVFKFFQDEKICPPIYNIVSYKIVEKKYQKINGKERAYFYVLLELPSDSILPAGKEWVFELTDFLGGWKITDFYQVRRKTSDSEL